MKNDKKGELRKKDILNDASILAVHTAKKKAYADKTLSKWLREVKLNRNPGRPKKEK
ncbi:MAG: hypothetical protein HY730_02000 [Candidatus Tectomicrobia bacterium]|uniref:Uncharacterized protein n=1 Tax=Tectimicrobiota bacterium TaxID=2528274 RepID=A0A933GM62_UNCTE|nr:hypothetical protein [Candidatus Tectomicrobia bacterium]